MCPIDLYDTLCFEEISGDQVEFTCRFVSAAGSPDARGFLNIPEGPENLVVRGGRNGAAPRRRSSWCTVAAGEANSSGGRIGWRIERCGGRAGGCQRRLAAGPLA